MEWLTDLRRTIGKAGSASPMIVTLASIDPTGLPRARSVVCRRLDDDGRAWIVSDARSDKNRQLRHTPHAEAVYWSPTTRDQFRVYGDVELLADGEPRLRLWKDLTDAARAPFVWPEPGAPRVADSAAFRAAVLATEPPPDSFNVIVLTPQVVEHLDLNPHPHRRRRWRRDVGWRCDELNP